MGTQTAVLLCMMGLQKYSELTVDDVQTTNECGRAIADLEKAIAHRGTSSPLILAAMAAGGPEFLDAVTTYEKNVIGFNKKYQSRELLVSIYPQDGTVIAEHPFAIMDQAPWVDSNQVEAAIDGAVGFVKEIGGKDWLFWLPFDGQLYPGAQGFVEDVGEQLEEEIRSTTARGETALYDAIAHAYRELEERRESQGDTARYGIVILSDGQDTKSRTTLPMLEGMLRPTESEQTGIQVHTIGIGKDAEDQVLTKIANFTHGGRYWKVKDPKTIEAVYKRISKYF